MSTTPTQLHKVGRIVGHLLSADRELPPADRRPNPEIAQARIVDIVRHPDWASWEAAAGVARLDVADRDAVECALLHAAYPPPPAADPFAGLS